MSGKNALVLLFVLGLFAVVFSVGTRLTSETLNVIVGLVCGVGAMIPVIAGLLLALTRERRTANKYVDAADDDRSRHQPAPPPMPQAYPPIIVMAPPTGQLPNPYQLPPNALPPGYNMNEPPRSRDFKIIGEDDDDL